MEKFKKLIGQGIRFAMVGCINTLVDMAVYFLLTLTAFFSAHYLFAQIISYCCGVLNSLWMNKRFTFREKNAMGTKRVLAFFAVNLVSLGVSTLVLFLCVDKAGLGNLLGKCVSVVFSLGVNFVLNKLIVFRD